MLSSEHLLSGPSDKSPALSQYKSTLGRKEPPDCMSTQLPFRVSIYDSYAFGMHVNAYSRQQAVAGQLRKWASSKSHSSRAGVKVGVAPTGSLQAVWPCNWNETVFERVEDLLGRLGNCKEGGRGKGGG